MSSQSYIVVLYHKMWYFCSANLVEGIDAGRGRITNRPSQAIPFLKMDKRQPYMEGRHALG